MSEFENKILELLKNIDKKLDNLLGVGGSTPTSTPAPTEVPTEVMPAASKPTPAAKPPEAAIEQPKAVKPQEISAAEGRRVCPKCSSTEFNQIEDKSKILHSMGGIKMYAKSYQCKKCGFIL